MFKMLQLGLKILLIWYLDPNSIIYISRYKYLYFASNTIHCVRKSLVQTHKKKKNAIQCVTSVKKLIQMSLLNTPY